MIQAALVIITVAQENDHASSWVSWVSLHAFVAGQVECVKERGCSTWRHVDLEPEQLIPAHKGCCVRNLVKSYYEGPVFIRFHYAVYEIGTCPHFRPVQPTEPLRVASVDQDSESQRQFVRGSDGHD